MEYLTIELRLALVVFGDEADPTVTPAVLDNRRRHICCFESMHFPMVERDMDHMMESILSVL
jgi:hypothetical protein